MKIICLKERLTLSIVLCFVMQEHNARYYNVKDLFQCIKLELITQVQVRLIYGIICASRAIWIVLLHNLCVSVLFEQLIIGNYLWHDLIPQIQSGVGGSVLLISQLHEIYCFSTQKSHQICYAIYLSLSMTNCTFWRTLDNVFSFCTVRT